MMDNRLQPGTDEPEMPVGKWESEPPVAGSAICSAMNDVPYSNLKTNGQIFWRQEPCENAAQPGSKYCLMHQDIEKRERAMSESLMTALKASGSWPNADISDRR